MSTEEKKWYNVDWTEEIALITLGIVATVSLLTSGITQIPLVIVSGMIGYLTRKKKETS